MKIKIELDTENWLNPDCVIKVFSEAINRTKEIMDKAKEEQSDVKE